MMRPMSLAPYAQAIVAAYHDRQPIEAAAAFGPRGAAEAYAVQRAVWQTLAGDARPTAWKVAATAPATRPFAAPILPQRLFASGPNSPASVPIDLFIRPGLEAEIAVRFGRDLPPRPQPYQTAEIRAAIADLCVAMEVIDCRLGDAQSAGSDWRLADHLLNGALILGTPLPDWQDLGLDALQVRVHGGEQCLCDRPGQQPLGDLFHCLPWLIEHAGGLRAGDVVTTGAWTGMHPLDGLEGLASLPFSCLVEFSGLGSASLTLHPPAAAARLLNPHHNQAAGMAQTTRASIR